MNIVDCTPPADLPDVVIVLNPLGPSFYLHVRTEDGFDAKTLTSSTLPGAREEAAALGFVPTAWVDALGLVTRFPLPPCPYCGRPAKVYQEHPDHPWWFAECSSTQQCVGTGSEPSREAAEAAWVRLVQVKSPTP